jgi:hypothetical protein
MAGYARALLKRAILPEQIAWQYVAKSRQRKLGRRPRTRASMCRRIPHVKCVSCLSRRAHDAGPEEVPVPRASHQLGSIQCRCIPPTLRLITSGAVGKSRRPASRAAAFFGLFLSCLSHLGLRELPLRKRQERLVHSYFLSSKTALIIVWSHWFSIISNA